MRRASVAVHPLRRGLATGTARGLLGGSDRARPPYVQQRSHVGEGKLPVFPPEAAQRYVADGRPASPPV